MNLALMVIFIVGYFFVAAEHSVRMNKAGTALVMGGLCWVVYIFLTPDKETSAASLIGHLAGSSQILFFLMGAMAIVELIDAHDGFELITQRIHTRSRRKLLWITGLLTFFLSAVLDNLTTTIVMVSLIRKLMMSNHDRLIFCGAIVLAANAGGVWSPIGDVTTTMLWIGGQITAANIIGRLFIPSAVCLLVPLLILHTQLKGDVESPQEKFSDEEPPNMLHRNIVFCSGLFVLIMVPALKAFMHIPPFLGVLLGLGLLWILVEVLHSDKDERERKYYTVSYALRKIDTPSILFFLGILLAIGALEASGQLQTLAAKMNSAIPNENGRALALGILSSVIDNVPLVAASQGMYSLQLYSTDHFFWELLAYATGTGGSLLVIGSAAGVAAMSMEKMNFAWYLRRISLPALAGYASGAAVYLLM